MWRQYYSNSLSSKYIRNHENTPFLKEELRFCIFFIHTYISITIVNRTLYNQAGNDIRPRWLYNVVFTVCELKKLTLPCDFSWIYRHIQLHFELLWHIILSKIKPKSWHILSNRFNINLIPHLIFVLWPFIVFKQLVFKKK